MQCQFSNTLLKSTQKSSLILLWMVQTGMHNMTGLVMQVPPSKGKSQLVKFFFSSLQLFLGTLDSIEIWDPWLQQHMHIGRNNLKKWSYSIVSNSI